MKTSRLPERRNALAQALFLTALLVACADGGPTDPAVDASEPTQPAAANANPAVLPRNARPMGKTYEEWAVAYREWWASIPLASNPAADETGEFCGEGQSGPVWYLAARLGPGTSVRECQVPAGKMLYVPLLGIIAWAPEDLAFAAFVAETFLGLEPATMTDEELIRSLANFLVDSVTDLTLIVDGVAYVDLFSYRAESPAFDLTDTTLLDDRGLAISHPNLSVADGYALILSPLRRGAHTIEIHVELDNPLIGQGATDVTYHLSVGPR